MALTRQKVACIIFGPPSEMPENQLPTYTDVIKFYNFTKQKLKSELNNKDPFHHDVAEHVLQQIEQIWDKASIPHVSHRRAQEMMNIYHKKYMTLLKQPKSRKDSAPYREKLGQFTTNSSKLFDICSCTCPWDCSTSPTPCQCEKLRKIPEIERSFMEDRRSSRCMIICGLDKIESSRLTNRFVRNESILRQMTPLSTGSTSLINDVDKDEADFCDHTSSTEEDIDDDSDDEDIMLMKEKPKLKDTQMRVKLPSLAIACDRHGVSDRAAAGIVSAVLQDIGIIHSEDKTKVIDRSKVRRERRKKRCAVRTEASNTINGLYFDGRKDKTMIQIKERDGKFHRKIITEEHISIVAEPGSSYFGHITSSGGSSKIVSAELIKYLKSRNVDTSTIKAAGCDGTAVNTGNKAGIIRLLEVTLERPLQWFVCQLHANELPLRHLFQHLDGPTTGPKGFAGTIGKSLHNCEKLPIVNYVPLSCVLPQHVTSNDLSTDQKYLFDLCTAISVGVCQVDLSLRNPGLINHSRWLTTANRILRLYVATRSPSDELQTLVVFILTVYAPMWFEIKNSPSCKDGARHVHSTIVKSRYLTETLKAVVDPVIQRNAYFSHPENLLLAMLTDDRPEIRELALRRILKARKQETGSQMRLFSVPILNFQATSYIEMIDWGNIPITEPPITMDIADETLITMIRAHSTPTLEFARYPCHTQAVERHIKLVTEASERVCGQESRDGFIRTRLQSRSKMPKFDTKAEHTL